MQIFLWLLYVSSNWFSFYDFILSLTKLLHTWLLSNLTQVTMNTRKKLRLAWDLSPQTSISIFHKRYMSKTHNIQARIDVYFMNPRQQKFSFMSHRLISFVKALYWNLFPECTKMRILGVILQNFTGGIPPDPLLPLKLICDVTRLWRNFAPLLENFLRMPLIAMWHWSWDGYRRVVQKETQTELYLLIVLAGIL